MPEDVSGFDFWLCQYLHALLELPIRDLSAREFRRFRILFAHWCVHRRRVTILTNRKVIFSTNVYSTSEQTVFINFQSRLTGCN